MDVKLLGHGGKIYPRYKIKLGCHWSGKFKVREKSGNFVIGQGQLKFCKKSGKSRPGQGKFFHCTRIGQGSSSQLHFCDILVKNLIFEIQRKKYTVRL